MNGDEQVVREVLRSRAEDVDTVADFVGPSVGLARRRSRRAAAAGATAAVLVVSGVSVATWLAARPATPEPVPATVAPAPSASGTPSTTPTPSPSPSDTPSPSASPTGASSGVTVPWAAGSTVHLPGGTIDVGQGRVVRQLAPLAGGGALVATDPGGAGSLRWRVLGADGDVLQDLGRAAWVETSRDGRLLAPRWRSAQW